jgi:hypothetical protein
MKIVSLLNGAIVSSLLALPVQVVSAESAKPEKATFGVEEAFHAIFNRDHNRREHDTEPQPMLVINAGHGRTGTSSFCRAMERLGFKTYHMKDGVLDTPGHLEMWFEFLVKKAIGIHDVLDVVSKSGFNASADAPINLFYKEQMELYPDAPVILSVRGGDNPADSWQQSMRDTVLRFPAIMSRIPFQWIRTPKLMVPFIREMNKIMLPDDMMDSINDIPRSEVLADAYDKWVESVKAHVPSERLLIFRANDGWKPLCDHISHVAPIVAENCAKLIESGERYPHVNDTKSMQRAQSAMICVTGLTYVLLALPFLYLLVRLTRKKGVKKSTTNKGKAD